MLDDFSVGIESEDVDPGPVIPSGPLLVTVEDHVVAFCDHSLERDPLARVLRGHSLEVFNEGLLAVRHLGIVLCVVDSLERFAKGRASRQNMGSLVAPREPCVGSRQEHPMVESRTRPPLALTAALVLLMGFLILQALGYGIGFFLDPVSGLGEFVSPPPPGNVRRGGSAATPRNPVPRRDGRASA